MLIVERLLHNTTGDSCVLGGSGFGGKCEGKASGLNLNLGLGTNCDFRRVGYVLFHVPLK